MVRKGVEEILVPVVIPNDDILLLSVLVGNVQVGDSRSVSGQCAILEALGKVSGSYAACTYP